MKIIIKKNATKKVHNPLPPPPSTDGEGRPEDPPGVSPERPEADTGAERTAEAPRMVKDDPYVVYNASPTY